MSASLALAVLAAGAAGVSAQERVDAGDLISSAFSGALTGADTSAESSDGGSGDTAQAVFTLSAAAQAQAGEAQASAGEDQAHFIESRSAVNAARSLAIGQAEEAERLAAEEAARIRAEEEAQAAREAQRVSLIENARSNPKGAAQALMGDFGFGSDQWGCLEKLVQGESNWNYKARNPSSGAYGLFQSLPGHKMGSVAGDWADNPVTQITWGLGYIKGRYGTPCGAYNTWLSRSPHWY